MKHRTLQRLFDPGAADRHFLAGDLLALLREVAMADRMCADGDQRLVGERLQFVPGHAEIAADRGLVDAVTRTQRGNFAPAVMHVRQRAQPVVQAFERGLLGRRRGRVETDRGAADRRFDRIGLRDHHLQRDPPQPAGALGEIAGDIDGQGCVKFSHHRQREIPVVAIAVVEGEAGERPREVALHHSLVQRVDGDDVDAARAKVRQHRAQELRHHFEMAVGLELRVTLRTDLMKREDRADAGEDRPQQMMRPGEIQRAQSGADDVAAKKLLHAWE